MLREPDHLAGEQRKRPTRPPAGRCGARRRDEKRLFFLRELAIGAGARQLAERSFESLLHEASLRSKDRRRAHRDVLRDRRVARAGFRREKNLSALEPPKRALAGQDEAAKLVALFCRECDPVPYVHDGLLRTIDHVDAQMSIVSEPRFTDTQGQYLAFIYYYGLVNRRPPAEADIQSYFGVTPPTVHRMVIELERRGVIRRTPRQARSIAVCIPADEIPQLRPRSIETSASRY